MELFDTATINTLANSPLLTIIEFFTIAFIVIITYIAIHNMMGHAKPATKMLISMFLGSLAYTLGKLALLTIIVRPYLAQLYYIEPF